MDIAGLLIRRERLARSWSQEGLCRGICAASYLSKVEQGKAEASEEIVRALFARLALPFETEKEDEEMLEKCRELLLSGANREFSEQLETLLPRADELARGRSAADFLMLRAFYEETSEPLEADFEPFLSTRQLAMQRVLQCDFPSALALDPEPFYRMVCGIRHYRAGRYTESAEMLRAACDAAAEEGYARLMLTCRLFLGNCCSDRGDLARMRVHYAVAERLARAMNEREMLRMLQYNTASSMLEQGNAETAYRYFSALDAPDRLSLHKLALCCEKLGKREEGLRALAAAEEAKEKERQDGMTPLVDEMLALVRYRLTQPDYLREARYGALLAETFAHIRRELPAGFVRFHLPWMLEWYKANRQYRQACLLMEEFPGIR